MAVNPNKIAIILHANNASDKLIREIADYLGTSEADIRLQLRRYPWTLGFQREEFLGIARGK